MRCSAGRRSAMNARNRGVFEELGALTRRAERMTIRDACVGCSPTNRDVATPMLESFGGRREHHPRA
jgi:hypothetical protein